MTETNLKIPLKSGATCDMSAPVVAADVDALFAYIEDKYPESTIGMLHAFYTLAVVSSSLEAMLRDKGEGTAVDVMKKILDDLRRATEPDRFDIDGPIESFSTPRPQLQYVGGRPAQVLVGGEQVELQHGDVIEIKNGAVHINGKKPVEVLENKPSQKFDIDGPGGLPLDSEGYPAPCVICERTMCDHLPGERPDSWDNTVRKRSS